MIRTNLSTRPFYDERTVHVVLFVVAILVVAASVFNVSRVIKYSRSDTRLGAEASQRESRAADIRRAAAELRATLDAKQIEFALAEARQANDLIDRRIFSWTELLNQFETTLPDNVRITAVRPKLDPKRGIMLTINVVARGVDDVDELMEKLEATSAFTDLLTSQEHVGEEGQLEAVLQTTYRPRPGHPESSGAGKP